MRNLDVEGSYNVRDLGGYSTADGHHTRWKVFVRAGNLDKVSPAGCQYISDYGIKTVIDLRDEWEVEDFPNVFAQSDHVRYMSLPLLGNQLSQDEVWKLENQKLFQLEALYSRYLDHCQAQIGSIMAAISESTPGTLFHCYAGKDRTGLIAALVLSAVGVSSEDIAEDYAQTSQHIKHLVAQWEEYAIKNDYDMRLLKRDSSAMPETMVNTLTYLTEHYGGVNEYLARCGVGDEQIAELRRRFVEINE
ncbi:MAG: protein-tyrosine-phosphatase [Anaerolineaceae bacterium]|nr:protein-tyrosine-phosphatase [Anaerolineaceae bacterium]